MIMIKKIPKVLIFGQSFNKNTGGGITLGNLFDGWPKDKIAVANIGHGMRDVDFSVCVNYYLLGKNEYKWMFPFNKLQRHFESGVITPNTNNVTENKISNQTGSVTLNTRKIFIEKVFFPFLHYMGFSPKMSKLILSSSFKTWLDRYQPDVIYVQVSNLEAINFVLELKAYLKKPVILHMMDDWPAVISSKGPLKNYWNNKIDKALKNLLSSCSLLMSISHAMTEEYQQRFGLKFTAFHNPINIENWLPFSKNNWKVDTNRDFKILYTGRIGTANTDSIKKIAIAIDSLCAEGYNISLDIYSPNIDTEHAKGLKVFNGVNLKKIVPHHNIPALLPQYDLLVLPLDFDSKSIKFARLSMPTKASEFMISGTPILVFAPQQTALAKYAAKEKWAYGVTDTAEETIKNALKQLIKDESLRAVLGNRAKTLAAETEDAQIIRKNFKDAICSVCTFKKTDIINVY